MKQFISIILILFFCSCVKEDRENCWRGNVKIPISYTQNEDDIDKLNEQIKAIHLYFFEKYTGVLYQVETLTVSNLINGEYRMDLYEGEIGRAHV